LLELRSEGDVRSVARWLSDAGRRRLSSLSLPSWVALHPALPDGLAIGTSLASMTSLTEVDSSTGGSIDPAVAAWLAGSAAALAAPSTISLPGSWEHRRPLVMAIVNVTPDSFSDGGRFHAVDAAVAHGEALVQAGADLLDIGGESTRPRGATYGAGAVTVAVAEELSRVVPVIAALRQRCAVPISIDTRKSEVARAALAAGAGIVNDVSGLRHDPQLATVAAETGATLCLMHTPVDIEQLTHEAPSDDVLGEVLAGLRWSVDRALAAGVTREKLWVDPGLGFGKTLAGNRWLLRHLASVVALGLPVLVGASRKRFLVDDPAIAPADRLGASVAAALMAARGGAAVVRVHDVQQTVQALAIAQAVEAAVDGPVQPERARAGEERS